MRGVWFWIIAPLATIAIWARLLWFRVFAPDSPRIMNSQRRFGRTILSAAGAKVTLTGLDQVGEDTYVIVPNHSSMLDISAGFAHFPGNVRFVSRPFFFRVPFLGWGMKLADHVSLDPKSPREAARILRELGPHFEKGRSLVLFPEGTRSPDGEVRGYKRGPFMTAIQYGRPLLPVRLKGLYEVLPKGRKVPRGGPVEIIFGAPIPTEGLHPPDAKRLAREVEAWARAQ